MNNSRLSSRLVIVIQSVLLHNCESEEGKLRDFPLLFIFFFVSEMWITFHVGMCNNNKHFSLLNIQIHVCREFFAFADLLTGSVSHSYSRSLARLLLKRLLSRMTQKYFLLKLDSLKRMRSMPNQCSLNANSRVSNLFSSHHNISSIWSVYFVVLYSGIWINSLSIDLHTAVIIFMWFWLIREGRTEWSGQFVINWDYLELNRIC